MPLRQRVLHPDRDAADRVVAGDAVGRCDGPVEAGGLRLGDEGGGDDLGEPGPGERPPDGIAELERVRPVVRHRRVGGLRWHGVVARDAGDLLGDVGLDVEVPPPAGDDRDERGLGGRHAEGLLSLRDGDGGPRGGGLEPDADPLEERRLLHVGEGGAEQPVDAAGTERDPLRPWLGGRRVDSPGGRGPARPGHDELRDAVGADPGEADLLALLEAEARLRAEGAVEGRAADADGVEDRRFHDDVAGRLRHLGGGPAHDAGDRERPAGVGDQERLGRELPLDVVEGLEPLAGSGASHDEAGPTRVVAGDRDGVEGVRRLAQLEHRVVGGVHDVADRPHAGGQEAHLDPIRGRAHRHAAHPPPHEAAAEPRVLDGHGQALRGGGSPTLLQPDLGEADRRSRDGRDLAGQPHQGKRVAAVRLDVDVEDVVAEEVHERHAQGGLRREDQDSLGVPGQAELVARAEHAVAHDAHLLGALDRPVARQDRPRQGDRHALPRGDVRRAADDVEDVRPDAHPREGEPVGARVLRHLEQLSRDDVAPLGPPALDSLHLHAQERQAVSQLLRGERNVDIVAQPGEGHSHRNCSRKRRSLSRKTRRSAIPWRSIAIRSTPIPKAKPW